MKTTILSANEAKQQWGTLMKVGNTPDEAIVVESHGKPKMAIVPVEALDEIEFARRTKRLQRLEELGKEQAKRNADLSEDEIEKLADRFSHEMFEELVAEGKIEFVPSDQR